MTYDIYRLRASVNTYECFIELVESFCTVMRTFVKWQTEGNFAHPATKAMSSIRLCNRSVWSMRSASQTEQSTLVGPWLRTVMGFMTIINRQDIDCHLAFQHDADSCHAWRVK